MRNLKKHNAVKSIYLRFEEFEKVITTIFKGYFYYDEKRKCFCQTERNEKATVPQMYEIYEGLSAYFGLTLTGYRVDYTLPFTPGVTLLYK